jgi:hypothetical protein
MKCFPFTSGFDPSAARYRNLILSSAAFTTAVVFIALEGCAPGPKSDTTPPSAGKAATVRFSKAPPPNSEADWRQFQANVQPFLAKNCFECHGEKDPENNFRLDVFTNATVLAKSRNSFEDVYEKLTHDEMPPKEKPRPEAVPLKRVVGWLDNHLYARLPGPPNPGRVTLRRLNRAEYNNTMRDLLGVDLSPANAFPTDMSGYGFDNNGDVLSIAPVLMEKYIAAANLVLDKVINAEPVVPAHIERWEATNADGTIPKTPVPTNNPVAAAGPNGAANGAAFRGRISPVGRLFYQNGEIHTNYNFPKDGTYVLRVRGYGIPGSANRARPSVAFSIDGEQVQAPITIPQDFRNVGVTDLKPIHVKAGNHLVTLSFLNGATPEEAAAAATNAVAAAAPPDANPSPRATAAAPVAEAQPAPPLRANLSTNDAAAGSTNLASAGNARRGGGARGARGARGAGRAGPPPGPAASPTGKPVLGVIYFEAEGPTEITPDRMPESYNRLMVAQPSATVPKAQAAEKIIRPFVSRAFRRPVREDEVQQLMAFWTQADAEGHSFNDSLKLTLQTVLASPQFLFRMEAEPQPGEKDNIHTLDDYELASRLSYFLWSSMPDEELFKLAEAKKLRANLSAQVQRMLKDKRSQALVENFAGQWLQLRQMQNVSPDATIFTNFDDPLRTAMTQETQLFFNAIIQEDRSVLDLLDGNFTYLNERLARHYGIEGVKGDEFQRVVFKPDDHRGGLLRQASILTITSYPNRTSPVQRGKWVLENLLDDAPPPPPPNVPALAEDAKAITGTMRERMEQHRTNPQCAACHGRMDPIGFSLENYDAIGAYRTTDANHDAIDVSGKLPDGTSFNGAEELKNVLMSKKDRFARTMAAKMLTYALGRGVEDQDHYVVDDIEQSLQKHGYKFSVMINEIVNCDAFQKRSGLTPQQTAAR